MSGAGNSNISKPTDLSETVARKLQTATEFKFEGNYFYKKNNFLQAIRSYHRLDFCLSKNITNILTCLITVF